MSMSKQQKDFYKIFAQHGFGDALVRISPKDVILLIHIAYADIFQRTESWFIPEYENLAHTNFFELTPAAIEDLPNKTIEEAACILQSCGATDTKNIIYLYLKNLSELYRRRFKFYSILKSQSFSVTEQIGLRCLLEFGNCENDLLFSWMCWRKWIYDVDNRSAQETGYLFEPILASCLGGESVSHRYSPVKRIDDNGHPTAEGRQIDCYIEEEKEVYELKLRVTIAASGQGRFNEEMSFPREARCAGLTPILIVFDSTPSALLEKLKNKYVEEGGRYAIGEDAWEELIGRAGREMGKYIQKYIRFPLYQMEKRANVLPSSICLTANRDCIIIEDAVGNKYQIPRVV